MSNVKDTYFFGFNTPNYKQENEKYYKDDTELVQDSDQEFTLQMFKDTVKAEVQKLINKPYENIVVLAGAGASIVGDKSKGKTVSQLYDDINKSLLNDNSGELYTFDYFRGKKIIDEDDKNLENILSVLIKDVGLFEGIKDEKFSKFIDVNKLKQSIYQATSTYAFDNSCKHNI